MPVMVVAVVLFSQHDIKRMVHYLSKRMTRDRIKKVRVFRLHCRTGTSGLMSLQQNYRYEYA